MLIIPKCKCLTATHIPSNGKLRGFPSCHFSSTVNSVPFCVDITQDGERQIVVKFDSDTDTNILCDIHCSIEKLMMLFEGHFVPLGKMAFSDSDCVSDNLLEGDAQNRISQRLPLFNSADFCLYHSFSLVDFDIVLDAKMYELWNCLLDEMDIAYQLFLYNLSGDFGVSDTRLAFFVELAEPFVEIVKSRTHYFATLEPGQRGTSLKMCVDALISRYGDTIFDKEFSADYTGFLQTIVKSRNRIMHIKRNQTTGNLTGTENTRYVMKFALLYRRILLDLLGIDFNSYEKRLQKASSFIDNWK